MEAMVTLFACIGITVMVVAFVALMIKFFQEW